MYQPLIWLRLLKSSNALSICAFIFIDLHYKLVFSFRWTIFEVSRKHSQQILIYHLERGCLQCCQNVCPILFLVLELWNMFNSVPSSIVLFTSTCVLIDNVENVCNWVNHSVIVTLWVNSNTHKLVSQSCVKFSNTSFTHLIPYLPCRDNQYIFVCPHLSSNTQLSF